MEKPKTPAGWYKDPANPSSERYWDGENWGEETRMLPPVVPPSPSGGYASRPANTAPDNYLVWAIITTILCFWPLGIPAIINAVKVDRLWLSGDPEGAMEAARKAKKWSIAAAIAAGVFWVLYLLFWFMIIVIGVAAS
jgi:hypothetical protein